MPSPRSADSAPQARDTASCGVIGLGNPLRGDDGVVPALFSRLDIAGTDSEVAILEYGDANFRLFHALADFDRVLIVDAVRFGGEPGDHVVFSPDEVVSHGDHGGTHDSDLLELLELAERLDDAAASVRIFGIQPGETEHGPGLSDELEERLPTLLVALQAAITELPEVTD
jgi:hydrogenase maturation protease